MFPRRIWVALSGVATLHFALLSTLSLLRYQHVHQRTFDLALYARIAWGFAHADLWSSVLNTHALGAHVAPVLLPLGLLGRVFGTVPVLLIAQAACCALSVFPLARIGARRLGTRGVWLAVIAFVHYPNVIHVGSYEFHPGTLAVLPMTWAFDALDRMKLSELAWSFVGVLVCREDLALFCLLLGFLYFAQHRDRRALIVSAACALYGALAIGLTYSLAAKNGSLDQHFGIWGGSPLGVLRAAFEQPELVAKHFRERNMYLPQVLAPLSFFSLRAPHLLLPALPYLLLNLISAFPSADEQYSHYLTPAVPALLVSGLVGVTSVRTRFVQLLWLTTLGIAHFALGGSPLSRDFDKTAYREDASSLAARQVLAAIPEGASVQAPYPLLAHLAERHDVRRAPPPEAGGAFTVLDVSHRARYARKEVLLRTSEEPLVRSWLARDDQALLVYAPPYALFARAADPRSGAAQSCLRAPANARAQPAQPAQFANESASVRLSACLASDGATLHGEILSLELRALGACPPDLALRFGGDQKPARVELLCDGALSPARLRAGERVYSQHQVSAREIEALRTRGLYVGVLLASGASPAADDPFASAVHLHIEEL